MSKPQQSTFTPLKTRALRVGFVPLTDCAPLVMAAELGLFRKYGLNVMLSRELGWATIRDKIIYGELDAAHAVAGLPMAATLGLGSVPCECVTGLVLNLHGNGITLSNELCCRGVTDAATLRTQIKLPRSGRALTFGIVSAVSSHNFLLRGWLAAAGINPDRDVRIVVVPPPQMVANLKSGNLDGFCVGEPWNSVAVQARAGVCVAVSSQLEPGHPEKVLMVRREFAEKREPEHFALMAALLEACAFCDEPANHELLVEVLARPQYVGAAAAALRCGIMGEFALVGGQPCRVADFNVFHRNDANEPGGDKAAWVLQHMRSCGQHQEPSDFNFALGRRVFRIDLFEQALRLREANAAPIHHEQPNNELSFA
ncbi:MAG TPA: CmpA/NrtA family ABC transporter substrate-binding protein [Verrucomicrobiae bacterium]|nr:CmpA/NrtA family ABC transporter substrate-binding protein [Verrucomicrobiae bacterium]